MHQAAADGHAEEVAQPIAEGEDVAATDNALLTPLRMAALRGQVEAAKALVAAGAPIDARDAYGNTPLAKAVFAFQGGIPRWFGCFWRRVPIQIPRAMRTDRRVTWR